MEIIRSWEFDNKLLQRNVCLILKVYEESSRCGFPAIDVIENSIENLNRKILLENSATNEDAEAEYDRLDAAGNFACMWQFAESIIDKHKLSVAIPAYNIFGVQDFEEDIADMVCVTNDCQNIIMRQQILPDGKVSQGKNIVQILRKTDNILKLEA